MFEVRTINEALSAIFRLSLLSNFRHFRVFASFVLSRLFASPVTPSTLPRHFERSEKSAFSGSVIGGDLRIAASKPV